MNPLKPGKVIWREVGDRSVIDHPGHDLASIHEMLQPVAGEAFGVVVQSAHSPPLLPRGSAHQIIPLSLAMRLLIMSVKVPFLLGSIRTRERGSQCSFPSYRTRYAFGRAHMSVTVSSTRLDR
jgi:hypothetical protein